LSPGYKPAPAPSTVTPTVGLEAGRERGKHDQDVADAIEILPGLVLPVAKVGHLIALKVLSTVPDRPQDTADLRALVGVASAADVDLAKQAVALIEARGFSRGKRLMDELERLVIKGA
jgi:hypothetical protein